MSCTIENPPPDPKQNPEYANWLIPKGEIINRGTPDDLIPALDEPSTINMSSVDFLEDDDLILGVNVNGEFRAYPIGMLNYHEAVNDNIRTTETLISYSPLSGSSAAWNRGDLMGISSTFGISEVIYKSNHILYDRQTNSHWLPMMYECVNGELEGYNPETYQVVETAWGNWKAMFPGTRVLSPSTGYDFDYEVDPYEAYKQSDTIHFYTQPIDDQLSLKEKVHAILVRDRAKIYRFASFGDTTTIAMDNFQGQSVVVVGNKAKKFIVSFSSQIQGGEELIFTPNQDAPNIIMEDNQGNKYDIFGLAVTGPDRGRNLNPTRSVTGYWFAIAAMYPDPIIY